MTGTLQETLDGFGEEDVRVSARHANSEGWIDREEIKRKFEQSRHVAKPTGEAEERYTLTTEEGVVNRNRSVMSVEKKEGEETEEGDAESDTEIVVELRNEQAPWEEDDELEVGPEVLEHEPVGANHVAGLEEEKRELREFLEGFDADLGISEQTGIILEGPPGTGKTELVREICKEKYGSVPVTVSGPEILSKWVGESERALRKKFEEARSTRHKILYIDELDAIARSRDEVSESHSAQIVAQLLVLLDGVEAKKRSEVGADRGEKTLKVVASTNISHVVDPALRRPGRLGNRPVQFGLPDREERKAILHHYLEKVYTSPDGRLGSGLESFVTEGDADALEVGRKNLLDETDGFTGADIEDWVLESVKRLRNEGGETLNSETLTAVLEEEGFGRARGFEEEVIEPWEDSPRSVGSKPTVCGRDGREPRRIVRDEGDPSYRYRHRVVTPRDLLEDDLVRTKESVIHAFQHRKDERLLLEIEDWNLLKRAHRESRIANHLIGVLHEELLKWDGENVLILIDDADSGHLDLLKG